MIKFKSAIIKFDKKIFNGNLHKGYMKIKKEIIKKKQYDFFYGKKNVTLCEPVADMIIMQTDPDNFFQYEFYDLAVRYLAVENYYGKNDIGFDLYKKMHTIGGNYGQNNDAEVYYSKMRKQNKTAKYGAVGEQHSIEQFMNLIQSYEQNGYDNNSVVMADKNLLSMNGSHRITLAVYRNQEFINVDVHNLLFKRRFTFNWFCENDFIRKELKIIDEKMKEILKLCKEQIGEFYCILFPPAYKYYDDIVEDIKCVDSDNIKVTGYEDYRLEVNDFMGFIRMLYSFDSINSINLERKLFYIMKSSEVTDNTVPFRVVSLNINNPMYRLKTDNGMPESVATVRLKQAIRARYRKKEECFTRHYVGDYAHDVIIHSTDNYLSNKAFRLLSAINKDISKIFEEIQDFRYAVVQTSHDKISSNFPKNFYFNEDIDIYVELEDIDEIVDITVHFCKKHFNLDWINVEVIDSAFGRSVSVKLNNSMIIMFDYIIKMRSLTDNFIKSCLERRQWDGYFHLCVEDELMARLAAYANNSTKIWHADFIRENQKHLVFKAEAFTDPDRMRSILDEILKNNE